MGVHGLTSAEARRELLRCGPNTIETENRFQGLLTFLGTFKSPLVILLLVSSAISAFLGERDSFYIIVTIVLVTSVIDFFNTYRSDKAAKKLQERVHVTVHVYRDGKLAELPASHIVPGDVVALTAGDMIPADGIVLESEHGFTNESSISGESFPQAKGIDSPCYMGSSVSSGRILLKITETGCNTKFNAVVSALAKRAPITEFDREIAAFSTMVLKITVVLVISVFLLNTFVKHDPLLTSLLFAVALAVGFTPELLPMIIALNLSKGSMVMAKKGVIVKRLSSLQNFGSMDVLCTDKTGTLTEDEIALVKYVDIDNCISENVLRLGYLNSRFSTGYINPLDTAVRAFTHLPLAGAKKIDELPYDFDRKCESVIIERDGKREIITKGAVDSILSISRNAHGKVLERARDTYERLSKSGYRVLAVAHKRVLHDEAADEKNLTLVGFLAFLDPPRDDAESVLEAIQQHGISLKIITGDNELITRRIAQEISFPIEHIVTGRRFAELSRPEKKKAVEKSSIFAGVDPHQKLEIIQLLQKNGHVVGYMGDGINDAPSLKAADVGISVNNAVDIAKESADLILMHKSLKSLVDGVVEGRKTFSNTMKYLMMALSSNFGNVFSMVGASAFLPYLPMLPPQILLNNLVYDASQFAIPLDNVDAEELRAPHRLKMSELKRFLLVFGPLSSLFDFATFATLIFAFNVNEASFQTGWFIQSLATQVLVVHIIRTKKIPFIQSRPSTPLVIATFISLAIAVAIAAGPLKHIFDFGELSLGAYAALTGITTAYLIATQIVKSWFFKKAQ